MQTLPRLRLSLLDLLKEDSSGANQHRPLTSTENLKNLQDSVRENLNALLNTRRLDDPVPREFEHCIDSLLVFGLPDFTSFVVTNEDDKDVLATSIETAIRRFEPRLMGVSVTAEKPDSKLPRGTIHYRIDAWLKIEPSPEPIAFDTVFEASKWHFMVVNSE